MDEHSTITVAEQEALRALFTALDDHDVGAICYWARRLREAVEPPRPKVADCWGWLRPDGSIGTAVLRRAALAIVSSYDDYTLARIVNGVVTDEFGVPFNEAQR